MSKSITPVPLVSFETEREQDLRNIINDEMFAMSLEQETLNDRPVFETEGVDINISYPFSDKWDYKTQLKIYNLDKERENDLITGRGFLISTHQPIQKEIKAENGIFSPKYGQSLSDTNPFIDRYKCSCGNLRSRIYNNIECPVCHTKVKYVDDDFGCFGWMVLNRFYVIHPNLYKSIEALIGPQRLVNILDIEDVKDEDGHSIIQDPKERRKKGPHRKDKGSNEPYFGIGMVEFYNHFDEICNYYLSVAANKTVKKEYYNHIMNNRDKVFCQSIPVYTTHLRPFEASDKKKFSFEGTNGIYNMMSKLVACINDDSLKIRRKLKDKNNLLFDLQMKWAELYREIDNILSGKKGNVRLLAGGRCNFASRDVIVQNPSLRIDQVTLPYWCLVDILQQRIINVLVKTYAMSYDDAYKKWYQSNITIDDTIVNIIEGLMFANPEGLPVIINRNPSISRGSLLQMFCVGMTFSYTMALPLQVLPLLAADFDGDVLNVYLIINDAFFKRAYEVLNPRNSMYISNNDGKLNMDVIPARDTLVNFNTFLRLGRSNYTSYDIKAINDAKQSFPIQI